MSKLISISGKEKDISLAIDFLKSDLKTKNKKVYIINQNWKPKEADSPYVSSIFDTNQRFDQQDLINNKLLENDYVIVAGYTANTMARELAKFTTPSAKRSFCIWLDSIESITYGIRRPDVSILLSKNTKSEFKTLSVLFPNDFIIVNPNKLTNISSFAIEKPDTNKSQNSYDGNLLDVVCSLVNNNKTSFELNLATKDLKNTALAELLEIRQLVAKREPSAQYYLSLITPLGSGVVLSEKPSSVWSNNLVKLFSSISQSYGDSIINTKINLSPHNEVALAQSIGWIYDSNTELLGYKEKRRIIETWAMNLNDSSNQLITLQLESIISIHDVVLLLKTLPSVKINISQLSPRLGYVDTSNAPSSVSSLIENAFDLSTAQSALSGNPELLLLGHKINVKISLNTKDIVYILKNKLNGTELLEELEKIISETIAEKYPVFFETIESI